MWDMYTKNYWVNCILLQIGSSVPLYRVHVTSFMAFFFFFVGGAICGELLQLWNVYLIW
jgi:hypothetical protein